MFLDEDLPRKKDVFEPRKLDALSVAELEEYIATLEAEILRVREEIKRKKAAGDFAAANFFKK